jgi:hypothetical protein
VAISMHKIFASSITACAALWMALSDARRDEPPHLGVRYRADLKMRPALFGDPSNSMACVAPVVALRPCQTPCGGTGERGGHVSPAVNNRHAHSVAPIPHKDLAIFYHSIVRQ